MKKQEPTMVTPGTAGVSEKPKQSIEQIVASGDKNSIAKNIGSIPDKSLDRNMALQVAGLTNEKGEPLKVGEQGGGYPSKVLIEINKFNGITTNELSSLLIESGRGGHVFGIENDLNEKKGKLAYATKVFETYKANNKSSGQAELEATDEYKAMKACEENVSKFQTLANSLDKKALFEKAVSTKNALSPESLAFFTNGENKLDISNQDALIEKLIAGGYTKETLRQFVANAPDGSLSLDTAKKLAKVDDFMLGDLEKTFPSKFSKN